MRACPHCSREIQEEATKCRHCRQEVEPPMWLANMRRCPFCAEWIELDREKCPYCDSAIAAVSLQRTAPFVESSLDDLVGGLRREAESGPAIQDDLGRLRRGRSGVGPEDSLASERGEEIGRSAEPEAGRGWRSDLTREPPAITRSWEAEPGPQAQPSRRDWEAERPRDRTEAERGEAEPPSPSRTRWEAEGEPAPAEPEPKERRLGPFRLRRKEPKPEREPEHAGPEPLFVSTAEVEGPGRIRRAGVEEERSDFTALPSDRQRTTSSLPRADREALLSEEGTPAGSPARKAAGSLIRTALGIALVAALGGGGFLLLRGPAAPLLARVLATRVPTSPTPSPAPTNTLSRAPTLPPESPGPGATTVAVVATQTSGPGGCVLWEEVTLAHEGQQMCVYGEIRRWFAVEEVPFVAIFSEEPGSFALVDRTGVHPVGPGDCVMGSGVVEVMRGTRPNIDVQGELQPCPSE